MKKKPKGYREIVVDGTTYYWIYRRSRLKVILAENGRTLFYKPVTEQFCHYTYSDYYGENIFLVTPKVVSDMIKDKINWVPENENRKTS